MTLVNEGGSEKLGGDGGEDFTHSSNILKVNCGAVFKARPKAAKARRCRASPDTGCGSCDTQKTWHP